MLALLGKNRCYDMGLESMGEAKELQGDNLGEGEKKLNRSGDEHCSLSMTRKSSKDIIEVHTGEKRTSLKPRA